MKKVQALLSVALISMSFNSIFSQTTGRKEKATAPAWSQEGRAKAKADNQRKTEAYAAKFAARLAQCRIEQKAAYEVDRDMYNLRLLLNARSKEWIEEIFGPPCLIQRHPDRMKNKAYFDVVETWYYVNIWVDGGVPPWIAINIERSGYVGLRY
jgi:hypothetical protein